MIKKNCNYFLHCIKLIKSNKFRLTLTLIGIISGVLIYVIGSIGTESYYQREFSNYNDFDKKTILVNGQISDKVINEINWNLPNLNYIPYTQTYSRTLYSTEISSKPHFIVGDFIGTGPNFIYYPIPTTTNINTVAYTKLIKGRDFSGDDLEKAKNVIIITEYAVKVLFSNSEPLGKTIRLDFKSSGIISNSISFEVIGVIADTPDILNEERETVKNISSNKDWNIQLKCYIPFTTCKNIFYASTDQNWDTQETESLFNKLVIREDENKFNYTHEALSILTNDSDNVVDIYTHNEIMADLKQSMKDTEQMLQIVMIIILFISGFNILNTMLFSTKERIGEIGIRKAVGATDFEIGLQFAVEAVIVSFIGAIIAIAVSIILFLVALYYLNTVLMMNLVFVFPIRIFLTSILIAVIQGTLFSIIPAILAARTNIVKALRFE